MIAEWVAELPVHIRMSREVMGFAQHDTGVDVRLSGGETMRSRYLVGCDGGRSLIRKRDRYRVPRLGRDDEQSDRRRRDDGGARGGHPHDEKGMHALGRGEYEVRDGEVV